MLCSSIIFFTENTMICEIDDVEYAHFTEPERLSFVKLKAKKNKAKYAVLRSVYHHHCRGVDSIIWSSPSQKYKPVAHINLKRLK